MPPWALGWIGGATKRSADLRCNASERAPGAMRHGPALAPLPRSSEGAAQVVPDRVELEWVATITSAGVKEMTDARYLLITEQRDD